MSTCSEFEPRWSAFLDHDLDPRERKTLARHLETCAACRGLVQDLERLRGAARSLGPVPPPAHVWLTLSEKVRATDLRESATVPVRVGRVVAPWLGLAAGLALVTLGVYLVTRAPVPGVETEIASNPPAIDPVETIADELSQAMRHYENAMKELEQVAQGRDNGFDPAVVTMLRTHLEIADRAIATSREAIASEPDSRPARDSLFTALRQKVTVLQATITLMNELRQGDPAGAARAGSGLNTKG